MSTNTVLEHPGVIKAAASNHSAADNLQATFPGTLRVIRRNGQVTPYDASKISVAMTKAFLAVEGPHAKASQRIHETVDKLTSQITDAFQRRLQSGGTIHIEDIQDQVELALMRSGLHKAARAYVLYREERRRARDEQARRKTATQSAEIQITLEQGKQVGLSTIPLETLIAEACVDLDDVKTELILQETKRNLFDGVTLSDLQQAMIMSGRTLIEKEPNYSFVTARLLLSNLARNTLLFLGMEDKFTLHALEDSYRPCLKLAIEKGIELELLDEKLNQFDLQRLSEALVPARDKQFTYLSLQTLYDRYFLHHGQIRFELPQIFFMRVAMGLALNEIDKEQRAIEFYNVLSTFDFMSSTPTLFNSGTQRAQLSSCYLTIVPDDLAGIYNAIKDNALLSKYAGGLGNDWTSVRAMGAHIKGTNGKSQGTVPFMKVANDTAVAVNQGGKRKGAVCAYLETWHLDIEEFLELRKNTGDERRRTHDMNTANWIPDLFMKRVMQDGQWTLFSPDEVLELHDLYGEEFEKAYTMYEDKAKNGELKNHKVISAVTLWRKMLGLLFETGHPWITFKDPCNIRSPQQHVGVVHSSNLCTEITLNTSLEEIAVCNLGSINLVNHITRDGLDHEKLEKTVRTAIRMLDNVIDINFYSVLQARRSNLRHRPIGLGIMGFQDALYIQGIPYASSGAIEFSDNSMEAVSYYALKASCQLAKERGVYSTFSGSLWDKGILPIDSIAQLAKVRGDYLKQDTGSTLDWAGLRQEIQSHGMRNSNILAIAPTATISNICGVSQSIEPTYQNLFVKSNLSGEFTVINPYLVTELKALDLWDDVMVNDLKYFNGSIQNIDRIPDNLKLLFATAFEIEPQWLVDCASRRQKWIDQSQSLNLYIAKPSGRKLDTLYRMAWLRGLKTTYYLRSMGATNVERSTINDNVLNAVSEVPTLPVTQACSISDPDCEACQ